MKFIKEIPKGALLVMLFGFFAVYMLIDSVHSHNRAVEHQKFCLDQGYPSMRSFNKGPDFWCVNPTHAVNARQLGWKEN